MGGRDDFGGGLRDGLRGAWNRLIARGRVRGVKVWRGRRRCDRGGAGRGGGYGVGRDATGSGRSARAGRIVSECWKIGSGWKPAAPGIREAHEEAAGVDGGFALAAAEFEALEVLADGDVGFVVGVVVEGGDGGRDDFVEVG